MNSEFYNKIINITPYKDDIAAMEKAIEKSARQGGSSVISDWSYNNELIKCLEKHFQNEGFATIVDFDGDGRSRVIIEWYRIDSL